MQGWPNIWESMSIIYHVNRIKKNHLSVSINVEVAFEKI